MGDGGVLQQGLIYLSAAVISVPIAKKIGLGSVLGYLIAGILIGPFVLELVGEDQQDVMHVAEFGVVMMLFLLGLELQPALLWRMRNAIIGLGGCQVLFSGVAFALIAIGFGMATREAVAIGMILALSSTAIVVQSLAESGRLGSVGGQSSFAVLLFQDIAVIPMLAVLPLLAVAGGAGGAGGADAAVGHGASDMAGWQQGLLLLGIAGGLVLGGRFLAQPVFRFIANARLREIFTAAGLLLVVALSYAMQLVGVSPALGAFLGGVVLAESEFRHELESNIEPFKGLLLGLFFITVGATMDFSLFVDSWRIIILLVVLLMGVKFIVLLLLGFAFRMPRDQTLLLAAALCQSGEFGFVLFASARHYGVLDSGLVDLLILVVALSMVLTPLILIGYERAMLGQSRHAVKDQKADDIDDHRNPVIIAGYGRFGQIIGRLLHANGIGVTLLDHDASHIEFVKQFDYKVYFGDASRMDLLEAAGAAHARLFVITLGDPETVLRIVDEVRRHFPHLKILARAKDRTHAYELMARKVDVFRRETFVSALEIGTEALQLLGYSPARAARTAKIFREHDEQSLVDLFEVWKDSHENYLIRSRQAREELHRLLAAERVDIAEPGDSAAEGASKPTAAGV